MVLDCSTTPKTRANDCLTQAKKGDLLDNIANDRNAEEHTDKDVSNKLAKLVNNR